jgi:hypothetical protein
MPHGTVFHRKVVHPPNAALYRLSGRALPAIVLVDRPSRAGIEINRRLLSWTDRRR